MDNENEKEVRLDSDYWDMLEATARLVDTWPNWKTGEYTTVAAKAQSVAQAGATQAQSSALIDKNYYL